MRRSHTEPPHQQGRSGIPKSARAVTAEPNSNEFRSSQRSLRYGLGLLLVALCVGLAAALFLTMGTARAEALLLGVNVMF